MMATEATSGNLATSTTIPDHELNTTETSSQDVPSDLPLVNGSSVKDEINQDGEAVEHGAVSAEVSVSGGSDTEASKTEASKALTDEKGHVRTGSTVKKVASFKPVSVNKKFLAAKVATAPSKLGEKSAGAPAVVTASSSLSLRPRLVAKSGSGLRDASARGAEGATGTKPGAPDASAVWNKNRPVPPAEPKAYTDEELKQRYGIHLATRMKTDDAGGKQANWADIDDDDDDWAPASMEWADGTKITLPQADDPPPPAPLPVPSPDLREPVVTDTIKPKSPKPKSPAPAQTSATTDPTIRTGGLGSGRTGLVLKGASEKPTLVAKPPGPPTPVKSPWAPLPPVDKAAPVPNDIHQAQSQQPRFGQRDPHGFQAMPPPPAKEIAADDFSRTWRESSNASRELYDSKSGRYEPVNDARRGSRNESRHQPSLLQRPSHQDGPAEPSSAFQTHRSGGQDGYGRRRTSSNVSGGSGNFIRRMSRGHDMPLPHESLNARRGSLAAVSDDPASPRNFSPSGHHQSQRGYQNQQWQSRASPAISHPSPHLSHEQPALPPVAPEVQGPVPTYDERIEDQKKIMRAKVENARKRRLEEEAREEAAKKERIRLKLEAMGPAPEKKETPKEEKPAPVPTQIQVRKPIEPVKEVLPDISQDSKVKSGVVDEVPTASDKRDGANGVLSAASTSASQQNISHDRPLQSQSQSQPQTQNLQNNQTTDRFPTWAAAPSQQTSRNVWGPPTSNKTLGNGTFNPELSRLPDMHSSNPGPIGPPNRGNGNVQRGQREQYPPRQLPIGPPRQPTTRSYKEMQDLAASKASPWGNASEMINIQDRVTRERQDKEIAHARELEAQGIDVVQPVINDTWREVDVRDDGTRANTKTKQTTIHEVAQPAYNNQEDSTTRPIFEERPMAEEQELSRRRNFEAVGNQNPDTWRWPSGLNNNTPARGSRFFPSRDVRLEEQNHQYDRPGSPSPPPPTMPGHPAWDGDGVPRVSFPRPPPVVKLPPSSSLAPIGPPKPVSFAAAVNTPAVPVPVRTQPTSQDIRQHTSAGSWKDRINNLIGKKPATVHHTNKNETMAVDSSSKHTLEQPNTPFGATVSLPLSADSDSSAISKPAAELCFEEQEMGSLPVVKVPIAVPASAWDIAPSPKGYPKKVAPTSADSIRFYPQTSNNNNILTIKIPGQDAKTVNSPVPRQASNPRRGGGGSRGTSRQSSSSHQRGGRGRDSGFPAPNHDNTNTSSVPTRGHGGRGRYSGGGSSWARPQNTPLHT